MLNKDKLKAINIENNEQYLRQISKKVDFNDVDLKKDIEILENFCKENEVLAMAAVQVGIPKRIVYIKNTDLKIVDKMQMSSATEEEENYNEAKVLINPVITQRIGLTEYWESCESCLNNMGLVKRPYKMVVEYFDEIGKKHQSIYEGFESTVLSHELDHLDGVLHIDIADEIFKMEKEERKIFRQTHGYNIISKKGTYEDLLIVKKEHTMIKK